MSTRSEGNGRWPSEPREAVAGQPYGAHALLEALGEVLAEADD